MNGEKMNVISNDVLNLIDGVSGEMIACQQYQLFKLGNSFSLEQKKVVKTRTVITKDYFFQQNDQVALSGRLYVYDHDETLKYYADSKKQRDARKRAKDLKDATNSSFIGAMESIQKGALSQLSQKAAVVEEPEFKTPVKETVTLTESDSKADLEGEPRPDNPTDEATKLQNNEKTVPNDTWTKQEIWDWIEDQPDEIVYKKTLGVGSLIEAVVNPYLETLKTGENGTK